MRFVGRRYAKLGHYTYSKAVTVVILRCFIAQWHRVNYLSNILLQYRAEKKSLQILQSSTQAGPGKNVKQEQEEISRNYMYHDFLSALYSNII